MKNIIIFVKVMLLSLIGSCLMYFFFFIRGKVDFDFQEFYLFILEFTPMLFFVVLLSMWYKNMKNQDMKSGSDAVKGAYVSNLNSKTFEAALDPIYRGIESVENITPKKYLYISSVGYISSSSSKYIFNGYIDHAKSLKTGLMTPFSYSWSCYWFFRYSNFY